MSTDTSRAENLFRRATIGIITALPKEFSAVKVMLHSPVGWSAQGSGAGRRYLLGEIPAMGSGTHAVALALLPDVGTNSAAVSANNLLHHFPSIRHIIMCGIAGGIPSAEDDIRLGDIVVSNRKGIVGYDFIRQTPDEVQELHSPPPPGAELIEAVNLLEAKRIEFHRPWECFLDRVHQLEDAARPQDSLGADGKPIQYAPDPKRRPGLPRLFYGSIASANRLLKDERFRNELQRRFKTKAVEMEGFGIADAAWSSDRAGYLVVRGISDFCDMRKGDLWQGYAAVAAAAYVRALLESMPAASASSRAHINPVPPPLQDLHSPPPSGATTKSGSVQQILEQPPPPAPPEPLPSRHQPPNAAGATPSPPIPTATTSAPHSIKVRQPPQRSAAGRVMLGVLLVVGAVGLMADQDGDMQRAPTKRRSILSTLVDGLAPSHAPDTLVPTTPSPGIHTSLEGLSGLRRLHRVRALQDAENGQSLGRIPAGVFGYTEPQSPESLPNIKVYGSATGRVLEIHKLESGSIMIVGFARDSDVRSISQGRPARLSLSPAASTQARTAVAIPLEWIRSLYFKNQGDILLEVSP